MDVGDFLRELGLQQYQAAFRANEINSQVLPKLTAEDLKDLGVTLVGHRRLMLDAIAARHDPTAPAVKPVADAARDSQTSSAEEAERRPLSMMICDLVGSTKLSSRLDPEDLREVVRAYQACVTTTIRQFGGFIADYAGDGVMIYFGWPQARETNAESAVRAGLAVAAAVGATPLGGERLQVRIGIATGLVVVGGPVGLGQSRQQAAVGETPNLAARLQGLAGPDQVVIDDATRRQIGGLFACHHLGAVELKGLPGAVQAWQVLSENRSLGQFEALRSDATALIGRHEEMELLLRRWAQAEAGNGRVVLIAAEAGVGKSRLAEALVQRIATEAHTRLRYFCSPHHQDSTLYPIIGQMERAAGLAHEDTPPARLAKLHTLLATTALSADDMALIAELLSLSSADLAQSLDVTPQGRKNRTFEALLRHVKGLARQQPVLMVFDDIHWIDPSSHELLDRAVEQVAHWPVLLLAMFRPDFQPPWTGQPHVTTLTLARLDRHDTEAMVLNVAGNAALPAEIIEEIAERADGVPLFVEELTKAVLESSPQAPAVVPAVPYPAFSVPATLHASLIARLDRLGPASKDVAQTGAAIGRQFEYLLLASVTDLTGHALQQALDRLTNAGLLFARGTPPQSSYLFKHALVQDAAYGTLLRSRRQRLHARIAATLEDRFPETVLAQPALLAQHFTGAGSAEQAVPYWLKAAQQALGRSAMTEAIARSRKGLDVLASMPDNPWRQQQELDLQTTLGTASSAAKGYSATDVGKILSRAVALAEQLDRPEHRLRLIMGQWSYHLSRAEYRLALPIGEQLEQFGAARNDTAARSLGCCMQGVSRFFLGEFVTARGLLEQCKGLADPAHRPVGRMASDPYTTMLGYLALTLACLGHIDQARARMAEALSEARRLRHAHTLGQVLFYANRLDFLTGVPMIYLKESLALSAEHGYPHQRAFGTAYRGHSLVALGQAQEGLVLLKQALTELQSTDGVISLSILFTWLAEAHARLGQPAEQRHCLAEAARIVQVYDERICEAEMYRVQGDLLNAVGDQSGVEQHYRQAIAVAERQSARLFQLRASIRLARVWHDQGKRTEARDLLCPIYHWFSEGFDAPDLKNARDLLNALT